MRHLRIKMPNSVSIPFFRKKVHEAKGFDEIDSLQHEKAAAQNARLLFVLQHRKRYGLHAIIRWMSHSQSRIRFQYRKRYGLHAISGDVGARDREEGFNTASGMDCMQCPCGARPKPIPLCFNTASGMDCMQYCLPEALETVSPEVGFLILTPFSRFSPKCAELFCREKCFERGLKPVIARALLSTKET